MHSFTSSTLFIFINLPSSTEQFSWIFRAGIKAHDWQQPSACGALHNFSPALDILFLVLICVPVLMCVLMHLCPDTQLTPVEFICHPHSTAELLGNSSCHWGVGNTILHSKHAPMEKAFFRFFSTFDIWLKIFYQKCSQLLGVLYSKKIFKASKHSPISLISFFLFFTSYYVQLPVSHSTVCSTFFPDDLGEVGYFSAC